jgi:hypothetical protein
MRHANRSGTFPDDLGKVTNHRIEHRKVVVVDGDLIVPVFDRLFIILVSFRRDSKPSSVLELILKNAKY